MKMILLATVSAGLAVGLFWPSASETQSPPATAVEVELSRSSDGHFYAVGMVEQQPVRFLVDTGASSVALTASDARKLGIEIDPADYEMIGKGASGIVRGTFVDVKSITVGEIEQRDAKVAVIEGSSVSLLGQPFLEQLDEIVIRKDRMYLRSGSAS